MSMSIWMWALAWGSLGWIVGMVTAVVLQQIASDRAVTRRHRRRALLGLDDRPPRRPGAVGTARIHTAEYRQRNAASGMDQGE